MAKARDIINIFTCRQSKNTAVDYEQVISEYKEKISSLNSDLDASKREVRIYTISSKKTKLLSSVFEKILSNWKVNWNKLR